MALRKVTAATVELLRSKVTDEHGSTDVIVGSIRQVKSSNMLGIGKTTTFECDVDVPEIGSRRKFRSGRVERQKALDLLSEQTEATAGEPLEAQGEALAPDAFAFQQTLALLEDEIDTSDTPRSVLPGARPGPIISAKRWQKVPVAAHGAGDLIVVVGVAADALHIAHQFSAEYGASKICTAGELATGINSLTDRRSVLAARTSATDEQRFVIVAFGIIPGRDYAEEMQMLDATQVWAVVDASRKTDDTRVWVALLDEAVNVDALAVIGTTATQTPTSVNGLGVPIGWVEDEPALETVLSAAASGIVID
jgi:hypothetical protein